MITTTKTKSLSIKTSFVNKQILIQMAKDGKDRPTRSGRQQRVGGTLTRLGKALTAYTSKSCTYDESFDKKIRKLRPDWFEKSSDSMKQALIKMAKNGKSKPERKIKEGAAFSNYTCKSSQSYDESFDKKIRKLRPDWFEKSSDSMKQELIKMAKNGESRPRHTTKLGQCLSRYINKSSGCYDESFGKLIRKLRPDWFVRSSDLNKQILIKMAKQGKNRPKRRTKLSYLLTSYINKPSGSYNESFDKLIRKLRPDWFVKSSAINKQLLIQMAKEGKPKPTRKTKPGKCLCNYTNKSSSYDESFTKQIRKLRPDWFRK